MRIKRLIKTHIIRPYYNFKIKRVASHVGHSLKVNSKSLVNKNTTLGNNVNFNGLKILGPGKVTIGDNFHSGRGCIFITQFHNYNEGVTIPYDNTYLIRDIIIQDNVWLGLNVIILGGVTIGEGAIIQAGSVVVNDIPKYGIAGGHPAKVFKFRDKHHYENLKNQKKFH